MTDELPEGLGVHRLPTITPGGSAMVKRIGKSRPDKESSDNDTDDPRDEDAREADAALSVASMNYALSAAKLRKREDAETLVRAKQAAGEAITPAEYLAAGLDVPTDTLTDEQHRDLIRTLDDREKRKRRRAWERELRDCMTPDERLAEVDEATFRRKVKALVSRCITKARASGRKLSKVERQRLHDAAVYEVTMSILRFEDREPTHDENLAAMSEGIGDMRVIKRKSLEYGRVADGSTDRGLYQLQSLIARVRHTKRYRNVSRELVEWQNQIDPATGGYRDLSAFPHLFNEPSRRDKVMVGRLARLAATHNGTHCERICERRKKKRTPFEGIPEENQTLVSLKKLQNS